MRWLSYFPVVHPIHLTKEVGLIPLYMARHGYDAVLCGHFPEGTYPALEGELSGLALHRLPLGGRVRFADKAFAALLWREARSIDVLQLTHLARDSMVYGIVYKALNTKGTLYLKADAYNHFLENPPPLARHPLKRWALERVRARFMKVVDLVSIENTQGVEIARRTWPALNGKLLYLPYGVHDAYLAARAHLFAAPKENLLLTVSRPGSAEKNCELLLRTLPLMPLERDWRVVVVGPFTAAFAKCWDEMCIAHPGLRERVELTGTITDRDALYKLYARAKVFFLTSRVESFGIAFAEALYAGCVIVGHPGMYAFRDLSAGGRYGVEYSDDDVASFGESLMQALSRAQARPEQVAEIRKHAAEYFSWSVLSQRLADAINLRRKQVSLPPYR